MRTIACVVIAFGFLASFDSNAAESCAAGQKQLHPGEPCIPDTLFNYLYCLSNSGGGKIEVVSKDETEKKNDLEINVQGKGSGVIVKGEGGIGVKKSEASRAGKELSQRLDPTLAARCESVLRILVEQPAAREPTAATSAWRMSGIEANINRNGSDYKDFVAADIAECLDACVQEDDCKAITFNKSSRQCWMKNSVPLRSDDSSYDSAVKVRNKKP